MAAHSGHIALQAFGRDLRTGGPSAARGALARAFREGLLGWPLEEDREVVDTEAQFRDITRAPDSAAGSFDGTIRVPVRNALERPSELQRVLAHEQALLDPIGGVGVTNLLCQ